MKKILLLLTIILASIILWPYAENFYKKSTINSIPVITSELGLKGQLITYPFVSKGNEHSNDLKYIFKDSRWEQITISEKKPLLEKLPDFNIPIFKSPHGKYEFDYSKGMSVRDVNANQTIEVANPLGYELNPITWSPDDRYFIYEITIPIDPLDVEYFLMVLDVETSKTYRLQEKASLRHQALVWLE